MGKGKHDAMDAIGYGLKMQQLREAAEIGGCGCRDCENKRKAIQRQLDHPFYKRVDNFRDDIKAETLEKAADKYPEPFNPASWSILQLAKHAMAENYDQGNYIIGLYEAALELQEIVEKQNFATVENCELRKKINQLELLLKEANLKYIIATSSHEDRQAAQCELAKLYDENKGAFVNEQV